MSTPRQIAGGMVSTPPTASVSRRWGTISAITSETVSVNVGGIVIAGCRRVPTYSPTVGETVMLDVVGGDIVVVNTLMPSPKNDHGIINTSISSLSNSVTGLNASIVSLDARLDTVEAFNGQLDDVGEAIYVGGLPQSIPHATETIVTWGATPLQSTSLLTRNNNGVGHDFEIQRAGLWVFSATIRYAAAAGGGDRYVTMKIGTTAYAAQGFGIPTNSAAPTVHAGFSRRMTVGEDVSIHLWQTSGAALNTDPGTSWLMFTAAWIRP
jgi:hypothetical protein